MNIKFEDDTFFLVTGGAGFIGSNICEEILEMGHYVRCMDDFSTGYMKNIEPFLEHPRFELIKADIRNFDECMKACKGVDFILHQAALGSVPRSIEMPLLYEEINTRGTLNMLEAARQNAVKKFVYASSSSVYGDYKEQPNIEDNIGKILSPYALTKKTCEEYAYLYKTLYGLDTYGLRYFNVFGKKQDPKGYYAAVIPKFISLLKSNQTPDIFGDGEQSRDFTYYKNVVFANLAACLADSDSAGHAFNISFGESISVNQMYSYICEILGKDIKPNYLPERKGDIKHSSANIKKAYDLLGYTPKYNFKDGITQTVKWYLENE